MQPEDADNTALKKVEDVKGIDFKMLPFNNPRLDTNRKMDIVKHNPYDIANMAAGVTMSINGKTKGSLEESAKTVRD